MRALALASAVTAVTLVAIVALFVAIERASSPAAPDFRTAAVGGMEYEAMDGRPIDPANPVDRAIVKGLSPAEARSPRGDILFGAFISATNASDRPLRSADRIELRDDSGHVYRPLPLPATNPYAYAPRVLRPRTRIPSQGTPADDNLAATGRLILFRLPARVYDSGDRFELLIHQTGATASLII